MFLPLEFSCTNFLYLKTAHVKFDGPGLYFVIGSYLDPGREKNSSGSGKSTLLKALWWTLTGFKIDLQRLNDIVGHYGERTIGNLQFECEAGVCTINRWRSNSGEKSLTFMVNDEPKSCDRDSDTQERIGEYLGVDFETIRYTHFKPQQDDKAGFLYDNDATRKKTVARLHHRANLDKVPDFIERLIRPDKERHKHLSLTVATAQASLETAKSAVVKAQTALSEAEEKTKKQANTAPQMDQALLTELQKKIGDEQEARPSRVIYADKLEKDIATQKELSRAKWGEANDLRIKAEASAQKQTEIMVGLKKDKAALHAEGGSCPVCHQSLNNEETKQHLRDHINANIILCTEEQQSEEKLRAQAAATRTIETAHCTKANSILVKQREILDLVTRGDSMIEMSRNRIAKIQVATTVVDVEPLKALVAEHQSEVHGILSDLMDDEEELEGLDERLYWADYWIRSYRHQMRSRAFESIADDMTADVMAELKPISGDLLQVQFDAKIESESGIKDKFAMMLLDHKNKTHRDALNSSGGQKTMMAMATLFACRKQNNSDLGLLILDEPLEGVDAEFVSRSVERIRKIAHDAVVLFVTHNATVIPSDSKIVTVQSRDSVITCGG